MMQASRRGLFGWLLGGIIGLFGAKVVRPAVMWEEPEDDSDLPELAEDEDEETSSSSVSSCNWRVDYTTGQPIGQSGS